VPAFKCIAIDQPDPNTWRYVVRLEDDAGGRFSFTATAEELDILSAALDEKLDAMVEAAERLSTDD
jgi:hypothetical protein